MHSFNKWELAQFCAVSGYGTRYTEKDQLVYTSRRTPPNVKNCQEKRQLEQRTMNPLMTCSYGRCVETPKVPLDQTVRSGAAFYFLQKSKVGCKLGGGRRKKKKKKRKQ